MKQTQPVQLSLCTQCLYLTPKLLKAEQLSCSQRGLQLRIRGYKCDLARSAEHDKSFLCPDLTRCGMSFVWESGTGSALLQCQVSGLSCRSTKMPPVLSASSSQEGIQGCECAHQTPRLFPSLWKNFIVAQGQGKVSSGLCVYVAGEDLDAKKPFQNVCSETTMKGKRLLECFPAVNSSARSLSESLTSYRSC